MNTCNLNIRIVRNSLRNYKYPDTFDELIFIQIIFIYINIRDQIKILILQKLNNY